MTDQATAPQWAKVNPVTWAALNVYAGTAEGQTRPSLGGFVRDRAPRGRLKSTPRMTAQGLGCLNTRGRLTPSGWQAARNPCRNDLETAGKQRALPHLPEKKSCSCHASLSRSDLNPPPSIDTGGDL